MDIRSYFGGRNPTNNNPTNNNPTTTNPTNNNPPTTTTQLLDQVEDKNQTKTSSLATDKKKQTRNRLSFEENMKRLHKFYEVHGTKPSKTEEEGREEEKRLWYWIDGLKRRKPEKYNEFKDQFLGKHGKDFDEVWKIRTPQPKTYKTKKTKDQAKLDELEEELQAGLAQLKISISAENLTEEQQEDRKRTALSQARVCGKLRTAIKAEVETINKIYRKNKKQIDKLTAKNEELKSRGEKLKQRRKDLKKEKEKLIAPYGGTLSI
jgi:hypothetical protein